MNAPAPIPRRSALYSTQAQLSDLGDYARRGVAGGNSDAEYIARLLDSLVDYIEARDTQDAASAAEDAVDAAIKLRDLADEYDQAARGKEYWA